MAKGDLKTKENNGDVGAFLDTVADKRQRADSLRVIEIMQRVTGEPPKMWRNAIIGFGNRLLKYDSGRELDWMIIGFSPRKASISLYIPGNFPGYDNHLKKLGKHKTGKGCLYVKYLSDVDESVLTDLITDAIKAVASESD